MNTGKLLLTSTGLSSQNISESFLRLVSNPKSCKIAIVTTAAEGKEHNKYSQLAKQQFFTLGFGRVDFIDLEDAPTSEFSIYDVIYVCGGNTFKLLKFAKESNFHKTVQELLERDGVYIGVSAGSIIVGPSTAIANEVEPDPNEVGLEDLSGLHITETIIYPHYSEDIESDLQSFEARHGVHVVRISNAQAVLLQGDVQTVIE
jgi:dipeptidase E